MNNGEGVIASIPDFLNKFPKYHSHYSIVKRQYFSPSLTKQNSSYHYVKEMETKCSKHANYSTFTNVFKKYNVSIYIPKKRILANFAANWIFSSKVSSIIKTWKSSYVVINWENKSKEKTPKFNDWIKTKIRFLIFSIDLEKTQPLSCLNTSVAYYKRQLWL